jgi:hypothetical protein
VNTKGDFEDVPGNISFGEYSKFYADTLSAMFSQNAEGKDTTDYKAVEREVQKAITRYSKIQGLAAKAAAEQQKQAGQGQQVEPEAKVDPERELKIQAAVEALPTMFDTLVKGQPRIGRIKKGQRSGDKVYGEEAYNRIFIEAVERGREDGITPDVVKMELDKWWDAKHDRERGQMFQKYENRLEFQKQTQTKEPAKRKVTPEVDLGTLDAGQLDRIKRFKKHESIKWSWIRQKFGLETAEELKYICGSGNEQAIANALRRLGII